MKEAIREVHRCRFLLNSLSPNEAVPAHIITARVPSLCLLQASRRERSRKLSVTSVAKATTLQAIMLIFKKVLGSLVVFFTYVSTTIASLGVKLKIIVSLFQVRIHACRHAGSTCACACACIFTLRSP